MGFHAKSNKTGELFRQLQNEEKLAKSKIRLVPHLFGFLSLKCPADIAMLNPLGAIQLMDQHPEIQHWFIGGHSMGGVVAALLAMDLFNRFEGVVLLASYSIVPISVPALSIYGTNDGVLVMPLYQICKPLISSNLTEMVLEGGNHAQYGNYGFQLLDWPADISMAEQQNTCIDAIDQFIQANRRW